MHHTHCLGFKHMVKKRVGRTTHDWTDLPADVTADHMLVSQLAAAYHKT